MCADTKISRVDPPGDEQVALAVEVLRLLADATRLRILWTLAAGESSVNDLASAVAKPSATVSQHLAKLRMARVVATRREGTHVFYRLENDHVRQLVIDALRNAEHAGTDIPAHHRKTGSVIDIGSTRPAGHR